MLAGGRQKQQSTWETKHHQKKTQGNIYFVLVMKCYIEVFVAKWCDCGLTFGTGRGGHKHTPTIVPFSVSVLAVVTDKVETTT